MRLVICQGLVFGLLVQLLVQSLNAQDSQRMAVHEWGTFTALQNENGEQLMGINVDTEPVPNFVHNLGPYVLDRSVLSSQFWERRQKAVPRHHPAVSLRLETPVIYFYPPAGMKLPQQVNVDVRFRGGWLTEFYPRADVLFPVVSDGQFNFNDLSPKSVGHIAWRNLQVGTLAEGPKTDERVWLAPRKVAAANVSSSEGEHEKYLFYRGVAQQRAPLRIVSLNQGESLEVGATFRDILPRDRLVVIQDMWLMETRSDGLSAYRRMLALPVANDDQPSRSVLVPRRFAEEAFHSSNRERLEAEMREALLKDGLFADEAEALLSTWQQAYFTSPGLRVFYIVPREWTDHFLPLQISGDPTLTRVMVGRVELISDRQRELLTQLTKSQISKAGWLDKIPEDSPALAKFLAGRSGFGDLGVSIPADFQIYLELGRFRNALIAAEEKLTHSVNLSTFIRENQLEAFRLSQTSGK